MGTSIPQTGSVSPMIKAGGAANRDWPHLLIQKLIIS